MRLTRVDLPTLGRPATTTSRQRPSVRERRRRGRAHRRRSEGHRDPGRDAGGPDGGRDTAPLEGAAQREAVGRHDLDRPGQVRHGQVVEEAALGQAGVGKQVAVARRVRRRGPGRSAPVSSPATPMLPPKKRLATGSEPDVVPAQRLDEGPEHHRAVLPGEDGHRRVGGARSGRAARRLRRRAGCPVARRRGAVDRRRRTRGAPRAPRARRRRRRPRRPGPCRGRSRAGGSPRRWRPPGKAARPSGSTRRRRTPSAGRATRGRSPASAPPGRTRPAASATVCGRMASSWEKRLTPRGTQATVASSG